MRLFLLSLAGLMAMASPSFAQNSADAREAYVERRGLLEINTRCNVLAPSLHAALEVGAMQARGALLRAGWSTAQTGQLESTIVSAARARPCNDNRTLEAASQARAAFGQWANAGAMTFPGWERNWVARRATSGWRLSQAIDAPVPATFGVRQVGAAQQLALTVAAPSRSAAATNAILIMRNPARPRVEEVNLTQRVAFGLRAGAPPIASSLSTPSTRTLEDISGGRAMAVFAFPDSAFRTLLALDPRESVEIRLTQGRATHQIFVEVGDIAAARAFLVLER